MSGTYYRLVDSQDGMNRPCISLIKYTVVKRTDKGAWIVPANWYYSEPPRRFVLDGDGKRYAYPTFDQALYNYKRRKQSHIAILSTQHDNAIERLEIAGRLTEEMTTNVYLQRDNAPPLFPAMREPLRDLISNPDITITPKPGGIHHVKYDNPISPRTWTLDAS